MPAGSQQSLANFAAIAVLAADDLDTQPAKPCLACGERPAEDGTSMINPDPTKTWIEIKLIDKEGHPVAFEAYAVKLPTGELIQGSLDEDGFARVDGIDPGNCEVTFPNLDGELWRKK